MSMLENKFFPDKEPEEIADLLAGDTTGITEMFADPETMADPYPLYRRLLVEQPVCDSGDVVVLMRHADIDAVLRSPKVSVDDNKSVGQQHMVSIGEVPEELRAVLATRSFLHRDPPDHTRLRTIAGEAFNARRPEGMRAEIQQLVDELIDRAVADGSRTIELIQDLAYPLPITVICHILGVPPEDHFGSTPWSRSQLCCDFEPPAVHSASMACAEYSRTCQGQMEDYFAPFIAQKRISPGNDMISALLEQERLGLITEQEIKDTCRLMIVSGHETTVGLIANGMLALLRHPEQLRMLRDDPSLAPGAVDEIIRYDAPIHFTRRVALEDFEANGIPFTKGQTIMLWLGAANHDPAQFSEPERFDITRADNRHIGFGAGIHFCLGIALAKLEGEIALTTLARRLVEPRLVQNPPRYMEETVHALAELPIEFREVASPVSVG